LLHKSAFTTEVSGGGGSHPLLTLGYNTDYDKKEKQHKREIFANKKHHNPTKSTRNTSPDHTKPDGQ